MSPILALMTAFSFGLLAFLHLYWAVGGRWGIVAAVPAGPDGQPLLRTGPVACIVVAMGLSGFAWIALAGGDWVATALPVGWLKPLLFGIAGIFLARAIGDFRYVGFFKKAKSSLFARQDTRYFSPLCLFLALALTIIAWQL